MGPTPRDRYFLFGEMLIFGIISLVASFVLSYDAVVLAADPDAILGCSINAMFDCAVVGRSWQASVLGFPNAFLGLISEPVVMTIAVLGLSKVRMPRWFMFTANIVYLLGVTFAYWLLWQSTVEIGALCPWCITVTVSTTFVFYSMTSWNILEGNLFLSKSAQEKAYRFVRGGWLTIILIGWLALVVVAEVAAWVLPAFG
ncbi:MAG: vitamin K epoxide reductase family protein [Propionibacterium sp.]|nr:vitamin K epoxide reductase family protein [Propionibacterium sp.]